MGLGNWGSPADLSSGKTALWVSLQCLYRCLKWGEATLVCLLEEGHHHVSELAPGCGSPGVFSLQIKWLRSRRSSSSLRASLPDMAS